MYKQHSRHLASVSEHNIEIIVICKGRIESELEWGLGMLTFVRQGEGSAEAQVSLIIIL